jgi:hypothetical protein
MTAAPLTISKATPPKSHHYAANCYYYWVCDDYGNCYYEWYCP